ncbi:GNAT family N-acetyltransferase [Actinoplanes solisilvae]|uniref:GNAT family N-acetyltransferase n=1 Tax=Actinoplanes solisilvae TaxID=2486853 RepID=UPI000FDA6BE0|nr:GNAT family N-acetyltransferase [Actinoplanes solisilvae]
MSVLLRTAKDSDLVAVGAVHQRSRVAAYAHILAADTLALRTAESFGEWWTERYRWEADTHRLTVAELDGRVVGFTYVGPSETPGAAELYAIHVEPDLVGTGVGRRLMEDALDGLEKVGGSRAVLWVLADNSRARRFYAAGGWIPDGATRVEPVNGEPVEQLRYSRPLIGS